MNGPKKVFLNLGTMVKAKKKNPQDENESDRFYIKLEQQKDKVTGNPYGPQIFPITLADGTVLNDGDMLSMFSKREKLKKMVEEGRIDQEKASFLSSFLIFDICAVKDAASEPDFDPKDDEIPF